MSIRWIQNVVIDGAKSSIEIQVGDRRIGDKCYIRVNAETEQWFDSESPDREEIISRGMSLLKKKLAGKKVTNPDGSAFSWG
ncbi:MAG: hypothetical protein MUF22_03530 [Chitinispirillaceae bacterium]|jgi:hypothetical protein|nr:hypothetical protein [Chitinispirillaceae bacterium]